MEHCHAAVPAKRPQVAKAKRKLTIACGLCLIFITGEIAGGYFSGSLAIMSDAAHMFSDFTSFLIRLLEKIRLPIMPLEFNYSSGPNNSVVLNKHGGWTISLKLINMWCGISNTY